MSGSFHKNALKKMSDESNIVQQSLNLHEIVDPIDLTDRARNKHGHYYVKLLKRTPDLTKTRYY